MSWEALSVFNNSIARYDIHTMMIMLLSECNTALQHAGEKLNLHCAEKHDIILLVLVFNLRSVGVLVIDHDRAKIYPYFETNTMGKLALKLRVNTSQYQYVVLIA